MIANPSNAQNDSRPRRPAQLTILIPTYNRSSFVELLLHQLIPQVAQAEGAVAILVVDNASSDDTARVVGALAERTPHLRLFVRQEHVSSGEENYLLALPQCTSEFVWTLSDDDSPVADSVDRILKELATGDCDFLMSNLSTITVRGRTLRRLIVEEAGFPEVRGLEELIKNVGFVTMAACFSGAVFRREPVARMPIERFLAASPIYAHVAILLGAFHGARCRFIERPLVRYRHDGTPISAWADVSRKRKQQFYFPWTIGLARLFKLLEEVGVAPARLFGAIIECGEAEQFHLASSVIQTLIDQLNRWIDLRDPTERISVAEMAEMRPLFVDAGFGPAYSLEQLVKCVQFLNALWPEEGGRHERYADGHLKLGEILGALDPGPREALVDSWLAACKSRIAEVRDNTTISVVQQRDPRLPGYAYTQLGPKLIAYRDAVAPRSGQVFPLILAQDPETVWGQTVEDLVYEIEPRLMERARGLKHVDVSGSVQANFADLMIQYSPYFDVSWYEKQIGGAQLAKIDQPLSHFLQSGSRAGLSPNDWFSEHWYLAQYPEALRMANEGSVASGFHHYLRYGAASGHDPGPEFSEGAYLAANPDVAAAVGDPDDELQSGFEHWLVHGRREGRHPRGGAGPH